MNFTGVSEDLLSAPAVCPLQRRTTATPQGVAGRPACPPRLLADALAIRKQALRRTKSGFTLIELMVAVSIASILTLGIEQLLNTALTSWRIAVDEAGTSKISEELASRLAEGDYEVPGLKDAVELFKAEEHAVAFVPLWTDVLDRIPDDGVIKLTKRVRAGSSLPVGEIKFRGTGVFKMYPLSFQRDLNSVSFGFPIPPGAVARMTYHPDVQIHPELVMRYEWSAQEGRVYRYYNRSASDFELKREMASLTSVRFTYFDGANREVNPNKERSKKKASALKRICAVKIELVVEGKEVKKKALSFINIRALGKGGPGVILEEGLELPLPSAKDIRLLRLTNFTGAGDGQVIELKISGGRQSPAWRIKMDLGEESEGSVVRRYEVYYPSGQLMYEREEPLSLAAGFDLLTLDGDGRYDYDLDEGVVDQVKITGDPVTLSVIRSDPEGVMLIVRP